MRAATTPGGSPIHALPAESGTVQMWERSHYKTEEMQIMPQKYEGDGDPREHAEEASKWETEASRALHSPEPGPVGADYIEAVGECWKHRHAAERGINQTRETLRRH